MPKFLPPLVSAALLLGASAYATEVKVFRSSSQVNFLAGTLEAISIDPLGTLRLARQAERLTGIEEPYVFAAQPRKDGWIAGTGNSGRVLEIDADGTSRVLFEVAEPEIFAIWVDEDDAVFAGSSPHGKVYRWANGELEEFFDPEQTYIWQIARDADGSLLVATGTEGKLFRVSAAGEGQELFDSEDPHIRSLLPMADGSVMVGTAGDGLVLQLDADGRARTLFDADALGSWNQNPTSGPGRP